MLPAGGPGFRPTTSGAASDQRLVGSSRHGCRDRTYCGQVRTVVTARSPLFTGDSSDYRLSGHATFETYSVLMRLPPPQRLSAAAATRPLIATNFPQSRFLPTERCADLIGSFAALGHIRWICIRRARRCRRSQRLAAADFRSSCRTDLSGRGCNAAQCLDRSHMGRRRQLARLRHLAVRALAGRAFVERAVAGEQKCRRRGGVEVFRRRAGWQRHRAGTRHCRH